MASKPKPVDRAAEFGVEEMFFSTTDRTGKIQACNEVFLRVGGYSPSEMLGAPHSLVRHPDMPRCVFDLFWDMLLDDRPIGAFVKNMAKNGTYYWVFALALPIEGGFLSIRLKPTSDLLPVVQKLYQQLLAIEKAAGKDWRAGMAESGEALGEALVGLGFRSYEEFMVHALRKEISSRSKAMAEDGLSTRRSQENGMPKVFRELDLLERLKQEAKEQADFLETVSLTINRVALNSSVCAARMEERGRALAVLSDQASTISRDIYTEACELSEEQVRLARTLESTSFQISFATLASEMLAFVREEVKTCTLSDEAQVARFGGNYGELAKMLERAFQDALRVSIKEAKVLAENLRSFDIIAKRFSRILLKTRINRVTGRSMAASIEGGGQFSRLLDEMAGSAENARERLDQLQTTNGDVSNAVRRWRLDQMAA